MYCSGCGIGLAPGQTFCPQCGRPVAMAAAPAVPGYQIQLHNFSGQIRALSLVWFIYAALTLVLGTIGLAFANVALSRHFGTWPHGMGADGWPMGPWFGAAVLRFAWVFLIAHTVLSAAAGWGLHERACWGRTVAIVAAIVNIALFKPLGIAVSIWTLVMLMGYRNATLYEQL